MRVLDFQLSVKFLGQWHVGAKDKSITSFLRSVISQFIKKTETWPCNCEKYYSMFIKLAEYFDCTKTADT